MARTLTLCSRNPYIYMYYAYTYLSRSTMSSGCGPESSSGSSTTGSRLVEKGSLLLGLNKVAIFLSPSMAMRQWEGKLLQSISPGITLYMYIQNTSTVICTNFDAHVYTSDIVDLLHRKIIIENKKRHNIIIMENYSVLNS